MNNIYKYLIELTKAYLNNETITLKSEIDYADLFKLASKHNLSGVIYCVLSRAVNKEIISADLMNKMQNNFFDFIYISHMQSQTAELAKKALTDAGIRHIPFKGIELRNYFPVPESRFMGDIDILIDEKNRDRAKTAMKAAGFTVKNENGPVWDYVKDTVLIEMHTNLLNETIDKKQTIDYFSDAVNKADFNGLCGKFNDTFHLEYLMAHIAHHFRFYGAGIKLVLDIAVMLKYGSVDLDKAVSDLEAAGLDRFSKEILSICRKWYNQGELYIDDTETTENFIVSFGAFGIHGRNKSAVIARKDMEKEKSTSPLLMKLRLIFPPYSKLRHLPYISFINGKPYLTPLAWIYRIFYTLKNKKEFALNTAAGLSDKNIVEQARAELNYFEEIGLI